MSGRINTTECIIFNVELKTEKKMTMKKVYVSLPISGHDINWVKEKAERAAQYLRDKGYEPVTPFDVSQYENASYAEHMGKVINALLNCDAVFFLRGWEKSTVCQLERYAAMIHHKEMMHDASAGQEDFERVLPYLNMPHVSGFHGNFTVMLRALAYILMLGRENIRMAGKLATLNANYVKESLKDCYKLPIASVCKHEFVFDGLLEPNGTTTLDVAKRLLDYGFHAPTIYFPLLFHQAMMIEPTETESPETLDAFIEVMRKIAAEAKTDPELLHSAPRTTPIGRPDETRAARQPVLKYEA